ncbi:MAG: PAS domain S-box protein [bacterium]|nr:PAS domain S-box protein [bacterium]
MSAEKLTNRGREISKVNAEQCWELLNMLPEIIAEADLRGNIKLINFSALKKIYGYTQEDVQKGFSIFELLVPGDRDRARANFKKILGGKKSTGNEYTAITKDGASVPILVYTSLIFDGDQPSGTRSIVLDITARKELEDALKESEIKYRSIFHNAPVGIFSFDANGILLTINPKALEIFGSTEEQVVGLNLSSALKDQQMRHGMLEALEGRLGHFEGRYTSITSGKHIYARATFTKVTSKNGEVVGGVCITEDLTDRRKLEEEVQKSQKLESIGRLAGGIAHDYNNILTGVLGNISLAKFKSDPVDRNYKYLEEAEKAALRAKELTEHLLTFSKGGKPVKQTVSVEALAIEAARFALSGSNVSCRFDFPKRLGAIDADKFQASQLIQNLVINADQALPEGGTIAISACQSNIDAQSGLTLPSGDYIKISIKDSGIGIHEEDRDRIFDPFFTTKDKSNGLGLSMAYSIARKHDGLITFDSEPGEGSEFHIYFPAAGGEAIASVGPVEIRPDKFQRVLVMDDEAMVRAVAGEMLEINGYKPSTAKSGDEAVAMYKKALEDGFPFGVVIMDLTIPGGMGGKEAVKKVLELDPHARVVVSSGYSNDPVMADHERYGFCSMLHKPYNIEQVKELMENLAK